MRPRQFAIGAVLLAFTVTLATAQSGYELYQQAVMKERMDANLPEAIRIYERIVKDFSSNRPLMAKTLVQLGAAYEKRQDKQLARAAYDRVAREFATEADAVAQARQRLAVLDGAPSNGGPTERIAATGDDADSNAFITADGRFLARPHWDTGDLAVRDLVLGQTTPMKAKAGTFDSGDDKNAEIEEAMLSPDQKWIAYVWLTPDEKDSHYQLRLMPNQVGGKSRLLVDSPEYTDFAFAGWSPDGKWILAALEKPDQTWVLGKVATDDTNSIRPLKSLGWRLGTGRPSLSPDGRFVAYSAMHTDPGKRVQNYPQPAPELLEQHLYVLPTDGSGTETELVKGANINESPLWTNDGSRILFVSNRSGNEFGLWSVGVKDGKLTESPSRVRTNLTGRISPVGISQKGAFFYIPERTNAPAADVFVAEIDVKTGRATGPAVRVLDNFVDWNQAPSWSPDGSKIAFIRGRPGPVNALNSPDAFDLIVQDQGTGQEKKYSFTYIDLAPPVWMHDGKSVLVRRRYNGGQLFRVDLETGEFRSVEAIAHALLPARWQAALLSPDENILYLSIFEPRVKDVRGPQWSIVAFDLASAEQKQVWSSQGGIDGGIAFALSPDGNELAITLQRDTWKTLRLIRVGLNGGNTTELAESVARTVTWNRDGIYFASIEGEHAQLMRISSVTGKTQATGITLPGKNRLSIDARDGTSRVVWSQTTRGSNNELYVIDNLISLWNKPAAGK